MTATIYRAALLHAHGPEHSEFLSDGSLVVENGRIAYCGRFSEASIEYPHAHVFDWRDSMIIPGLVDAHAHLAQLAAIGCDRGDLLEWLEAVIFPQETQFANLDYTYHIATAFFRNALAHGTTTIAVYAPPFESATAVCFDVARDIGIRVLMGMTLMDTNAPAALVRPPKELLRSTEKLAADWDAKGRLHYCITPRFAGSCSIELLQGCAQLARETGLPIQTHLSESKGELELIARLFPDYPHYTSVYDASGLLTEKTILAHCIYLSSHELDRVIASNAAIVHCPASNVYLRSGIMPLAAYLGREHIRIGLGSDIGAGYHSSILDEARFAREIAKVRFLFSTTPQEVSPEQVFYLATLGGARVVGMDDRIGNFAKGKCADIVRIRVPSYRRFDSARDAIEYLLYAGGHSIIGTVIEGEFVWQSL